MAADDEIPPAKVLRLLAADLIQQARKHAAGGLEAKADEARAKARRLFEQAREIEKKPNG
jgi:hypothetical protein